MTLSALLAAKALPAMAATRRAYIVDVDTVTTRCVGRSVRLMSSGNADKAASSVDVDE